MIADDININSQIVGSYTLPKNKFVFLIIESIRNTHESFLSALNNLRITGELNENKLTQIFVEQNDIHLRNLNLPIGVKNQYSDIFHGSKGIPDFYYHNLELGKVNEPLFVVESKRLPSPSDLNREKEYVIGKTNSGNPNGGIERFKLGKHGIGLNECGLIAFIEQKTNSFWFNEVNTWILQLAESDVTWNKDEVLRLDEEYKKEDYFISTVHRTTDKMKLHHFWIKAQVQPQNN